MFNSALNTICEEHRSLAAVIQGLNFLTFRYRRGEALPDIALLKAIVFYLREFPQRLHHPKEEGYLLTLLRKRTRAADAIAAELSRQHRRESKLVERLAATLERISPGSPAGLDAFAVAADRFSEHVLNHMSFEETSLLPLAERYLSAEDWVTIGEAFGANGDPRFAPDEEQNYSTLFRRLLELGSLPKAHPEGGSPAFRFSSRPAAGD